MSVYRMRRSEGEVSRRSSNLRCTFVRCAVALYFAVCMPGCLVKAPPDIDELKPERANLNLFSTAPPITRVLNTGSNQQVNFNIPFTVFDAGQKYQAQLWLDWGFARQELVNELEVLSNLESPPLEGEAEREIIIDWQVGNGRQVEPGCHILTLQLTPASNIQQDFTRLPIDSSLVAAADWWVNVDAAIDSQQTLENCPSDARSFEE